MGRPLGRFGSTSRWICTSIPPSTFRNHMTSSCALHGLHSMTYQHLVQSDRATATTSDREEVQIDFVASSTTGEGNYAAATERALPFGGGGPSNQNPTGKTNLFQIAHYQQYFNVDTTVRPRPRTALVQMLLWAHATPRYSLHSQLHRAQARTQSKPQARRFVVPNHLSPHHLCLTCPHSARCYHLRSHPH